MPQNVDLRKRCEERISALSQERESFIPHWKLLSEFVTPRRGRFFTSDRNKGQRRHNNIINLRGTKAHQIARSGLLAGTMSPSRPWFTLETPNSELMESLAVKDWLHRTEIIIRAILNESNFYSQASTMIGELLLFGTGCMTHEDNFDTVARFYTHTVGSYMIAQNDRFEVDTLGRQFEWTVAQIVGKFGKENCSPTVQQAYDKGNYASWYPVTHLIYPNPERDERSRRNNRKRFRSIYYEPGLPTHDGRLLSDKGFDMFPAYCPRWDVTGEDVYGTDCPGMTALGDIKGLQTKERRKAQAIDKMVAPPLRGPASLKNQPVSQLPGGTNFYAADASGEKLEPLFQVNFPVDQLRADIDADERRINEAFFVDLFLAITMMEGIQPRNELDLMQRNEERLLQIGPVLERLHGEFLNKVIDRVFAQAVAADILPPPPPELQGANLRIKYVSALAVAQRAVATGEIDRVAAFAGGLAAAGWAEVLDKFDADQAVDEYAQAIGAPPRIVRTDDAVAELRQARQAEKEAAMAAQMAQSAANTAKMMSDAKTNDQSVLTEMTGGKR